MQNTEGGINFARFRDDLVFVFFMTINMNKLKKAILFVCILNFNTACRQNFADNTSSNKLLATVYNKSLYSNELEGMFPDNATIQDSQQIINAYVDHWLRDNILMAEAERNVPKDLDIEDLLKKYRESLILNSYEEQLTKNSLDTIITDAELNTFYEKNKEQYQLETPIVRCYFVKTPKMSPSQSDSLQKWWNNPKSSDNLVKMERYAKNYAKLYILNDSVWHRADDIVKMLPKGTLMAGNLSSGKELTMKADDFQYFFKAFGVMNQKEIAPLSYIKEQASKFILHQRKIQLIDKKKQEMYDLEMQKNNIKIYK
jgi:hypothetical protein